MQWQVAMHLALQMLEVAILPAGRPPKPLIQSWENVRGWFLKSWGDPQVTIWVSIPNGFNFFKMIWGYPKMT